MALGIVYQADPTNEFIEDLHSKYTFHELVKKNLIQKNTHPKIDLFDDHFFFSINVPEYDEFTKIYRNFEFDIVLGRDYLIITSKKDMPRIHDVVRENKDKSCFRIMYTVLHHIYQDIIQKLDNMDDEVSNVQDGLFDKNKPDQAIVEDLLMKKASISSIKHNFYPQQRLLDQIVWFGRKYYVGESEHLSFYLEELQLDLDHIVMKINNLVDNIWSVADTYNSLTNIYSNRTIMNLTIISIIFAPLSFLTGLFGVNFTGMPFVDLKYGFYGLVIFIIVFVSILIYIFRRKWWI